MLKMNVFTSYLVVVYWPSGGSVAESELSMGWVEIFQSLVGRVGLGPLQKKY